MGNNLSTTNQSTTSPLSSMDDLSNFEKQKLLKDHDFSYILNYIATKYILTMDFQSLKNLQDPKYCDEMIILTSDIIKKYFNEREIEYLQQKIEQGQQVNKLTRDKMLFFNKNNLSNSGVDNGVKKTRMCIGIAKFYIKIAHIFSAIVMTVNPIYVYKENNQIIKKTLLEKKEIPKDIEYKIEKMGICNARFEILNIGNNFLNKMNLGIEKNIEYDEDGNIIDNNKNNGEININLKKKYCNINKKINNATKDNLSDEPGIPELMNLYYDKYDYEKGEYNGMTDQTRKKFMDDLFLFYKEFTGIEDVVKKKNSLLNEKQINEIILQEFNKQGIKKFSDIKLKDYSSTFENICSNKTGSELGNSNFQNENKDIIIDNDSNDKKLEYKKYQDFLKKYAENLKKMLDTIKNEQEKLLNILNEIFVYVFDSNKKQIIIKPELTNESLDKIVLTTREIIIGLYLECESDYVDGLKLYQALIESRMFINEKSKESYLHQEREKLFNMSLYKKPSIEDTNKPQPMNKLSEQNMQTNMQSNMQPMNKPSQVNMQPNMQPTNMQPTNIQPTNMQEMNKPSEPNMQPSFPINN